MSCHFILGAETPRFIQVADKPLNLGPLHSVIFNGRI